ncbi:MAG: hypothetical protein P4L60_03285 [Clostridium sp.]|nr:hypothetical protein [Clostridium sp.]
MSAKDEYCEVCGRQAQECHHMISKERCKPLENCIQNHVYLCSEHHRGTFGVHGKYGHVLDQRYKLQFQNYLERSLLKEYLTREEIKEVLGITDRPLNRLLKSITMYKGKYVRGDVILKCMGGKLAEEVSKEVG